MGFEDMLDQGGEGKGTEEGVVVVGGWGERGIGRGGYLGLSCTGTTGEVGKKSGGLYIRRRGGAGDAVTTI